MSNRYDHNQNKHEGNNNNNNRGFPKTQKKFVPKTTNLTSKEQQSDSNPTLSDSLRKSFYGQSDGPPSAGGNRVRMGQNGDWVSSSSTIHGGNFVNYLPQDEAVASGLGPDEGGLDPVESQRVVDLLSRELSRLLKSNPRDFWKEVASDTSLHAFLESFLKFRSRWYDFPYRGAKGIVAGVIVGEFELSRRVFMVLYRISSHRDPGARVSDSLSPKDHTVLLQEKKLLDLPKLLDVCAIYGHENEDLTRMLVMNAIRSQPRIQDELAAIISHFLGIMHTMYQRCSSSLEVLLSTQDHQGQGLSRLHADYLEVMDFMNDAIVSLDAFVNAYKHAAVYLSCTVEMSYGNEELLSVLARLHDSLLPSFHQGFRVIFAAGGNGQNDMSDGTLSNIAVSLKMLSARIVKFGWKLLYFCFLSDELFEETFLLPATKIFPANVEDPVIRADILVQTFKDISGGHSHVAAGKTGATFLQNIEKNHKIMRRIEFLRNTGWIAMDDEHFQFLSGIMMHPLEINNNEAINLSESMTSNRMQIDKDAAIVESKISQIKEIFPDCGDGFLSACLEVYNHNPEEVIQRILEGTLHEDLQSLDTSLPVIPPPNSALSVSKNDKGKGKLVDYTETIKVNNLPLQEQQTEGSSLSSSASVGRYVRKSMADLSESDTLDSRDKKNLVKTAALISQLEYEDEYDDSYDDLGLSVGDSGLEDAESLGEQVVSNRGKQWEPGSGSSSSSASNSNKWNSRRKPLFYVKDGKNYSYKVEGSIAVSSYNEATFVNQAQKELIHGLGRGGNLPLGAVKQLTKFSEEPNEEPNVVEGGGRGYPGNRRGRGRRGGGNLPSGAVMQSTKSSDEPDEEPDVVEGGGRGNSGSHRGRGKRGGGRSHYRKDQAMRKHMSGLISH